MDQAPASPTPAAHAAALPPAAALATADTVPPRLARLFRHTLRTGGVNPLLHLLPRLADKEVAP